MLSEEKVREVLSREIIIEKNDGKKLVYTPLHDEFRIHIREELKAVLFATDTAVDYFNNDEIKEYVSIRTLAEEKKVYLDVALTAVRKDKNKEFIFIEVGEEKITIKSVYQRKPDKTNFLYKLKVEIDRIKTTQENKE